MDDKLFGTMDDVMRAAKAMAASRFFPDAISVEQAATKILAGRELGFGPFTSMTGIRIIKGQPSLSANMMAAAVKRSGRYNYRVISMTDERCEIVFSERGEEIGRSLFTIQDARRAGTGNLDKFPRNMLFARAMSNGVKWFCPDVFLTAVYTAEELGQTMDDEAAIDSTPDEPSEPAHDSYGCCDPDEEELTPFAAAIVKTPKGVPVGDLTQEQLGQLLNWFSENPARRAANPLLFKAVNVMLAFRWHEKAEADAEAEAG